MATPAPIDQLADRVERLLLRYQELQRAHMLLGDEMRALTRERDQLRSRLHSARTRVDALLQHLPQTSAHDPQAASPDTTA